jgi:SMC interacting uncharacterized protein involved in chromosome segregation
MEIFHKTQYANTKHEIALLTITIEDLEKHHAICRSAFKGKKFQQNKNCVKKQAIRIQIKKLERQILELELMDIEDFLKSY